VADADLFQTTKEMAMDIDDDETQRPAETNDFGIKPDFDQLEDEDKEVGGLGAWALALQLNDSTD
jgi:hypothetical protein